MKIQYILTMIPLLGLFSCNKSPQFAPQINKKTETVAATIHSQETFCGQHTIIRPKIDILMFLDNSSSSKALKDYKKAYASTLEFLSPRFDYRVMIAPLVYNSTSGDQIGPFMLMSFNPNGLGAFQDKIRPHDFSFENVFPQVSGSIENGIDRSLTLLHFAADSQIFRPSAHQVVLLWSNSTDKGHLIHNYGNSPSAIESYVNDRYQKFISDSQNYISPFTKLKFQTFHYITLVPRSTGACSGPANEENSYRKFSYKFYANLPAWSKNPWSDQFRDSFDICNLSEYSSIFDKINQNINDIIVGHRYQYWPVAKTVSNYFDPSAIKVKKESGEVLIPNDVNNGFKYIGPKDNFPTREYPDVSPNEPYSGHLIQLFGKGKVTYPECLQVETQEPPDYYGYVVIDKNPIQSSLTLTKNGKTIPPGEVDGWTFEPVFYSSKNIRVISPTNLSPTEGIEVELRSGYFIKLHGNAVYTNGDKMDFNFKAAGI